MRWSVSPRHLYMLVWLSALVGCTDAKDGPGDAGQSGGTDWSLHEDTGAGDPYGRDLDCPQPTECISLAEAKERGWATVLWDEGLHVGNTGPYDVCAGRWHTFLDESTQDIIAGHPDVDWPGEPEDADVISPGEAWFHEYAQSSGVPTWWCIEESQLVGSRTSFRFTGARAPTSLMQWVHIETDTNHNELPDQVDYEFSPNEPWTNHNIWEELATQPVYIVGRIPNYLELRPGSSAPLTIEVVSLGREASLIEVRERLPAGARGFDFSVLPTSSELNSDGSTTHIWYFKMGAAKDTSSSAEPAIYDTVQIEYKVEWTEPDCGYREKSWAPEVSWVNLDNVRYTSYGTELVLACCDGG